MPQSIYDWIGLADYCCLAGVALFGAFCCVLVWSRVGQKWFKTEEEMNEFLDAIEPDLRAGNFQDVEAACEDDPRAVPMLIGLGVSNAKLGFAKVRQLLPERFQRDVLGDLDQNISWVTTVIKTAPMLGLFGTVTGMIGAFATLAAAKSVDATALAKDINVALYTTAIGLAIAIPHVIALNAINNRIRNLEELVGAGTSRFLEAFKEGLAKRDARKRSA